MTRQRSGGDGVAALYRRPGFLIRHCHQIGVAIFIEELADFALTPGQYGALLLIDRHAGLDQRTLALAIGLDRSTTGAIVSRLAARGLVVRAIDPADRRGRRLWLTAAGHGMMRRAQLAARRAQRRLLAPLPEAQRRSFVGQLVRLVLAHADVARAPFVPLAAMADAAVDKRRRKRKS